MNARRNALRGSRSGFTLMEIMLVLGVMVIITAAAWPYAIKAYKTFNLKSAGEQMQSAFGRAHNVAMRTGITQAIHIEEGTDKYTLEAIQDATSSTEGDGSTVGGAITVGDGNSSDSNVSTKQLPDGFTFASAQRTSEDTRTAAADAVSTESNSSLPPILFFADGTSSDASVTVADKDGLKISVKLRGLTGTSRLGSIFTADNDANGGAK